MAQMSSESAPRSMALASLVKVCPVEAALAAVQIQRPRILILLQNTTMGLVNTSRVVPTPRRATTTRTLWKTMGLARSWMSAVFAAVLAFQKEPVIVKETSLTNVVFAVV